jgi:hypothetical protein
MAGDWSGRGGVHWSGGDGVTVCGYFCKGGVEEKGAADAVWGWDSVVHGYWGGGWVGGS